MSPYTVNVLKFRTLFSFQIKSWSFGQEFAKCLLAWRTWKTLIRLLLHCLSRPFRYATSVQNFRTFTEKCSTISNTFLFLFSNKIMVIKAGLHKLLDRIATGKTLIRLLIQKQSDLVLPFLYRHFCRQLVFKVLEHLP